MTTDAAAFWREAGPSTHHPGLDPAGGAEPSLAQAERVARIKGKVAEAIKELGAVQMLPEGQAAVQRLLEGAMWGTRAVLCTASPPREVELEPKPDDEVVA